MPLKCGIVGLPNVGKSTLFNALTASNTAAMADYPFCTIDPNHGLVKIPDGKLDIIAKIANAKLTKYSYIEFVDIAGLVKGASKGEGLGNQFLGHIRSVDAIIHVIKCFNDINTINNTEDLNPINDVETIETELLIADLDLIEKQILILEKKINSGIKSQQKDLTILKQCANAIDKGIEIKNLQFNAEDKKILDNISLLTTKPSIYVCNVHENDIINGNNYSRSIESIAKKKNIKCLIISSKLEQEISELEDLNEKLEFIKATGIEKNGLEQITTSVYQLLKLQSFYTVGKKEAKAWSFKIGTTAHKAAGIIHTDFERGFIKVEVIDYQDYLNIGDEKKIKELGKLRVEGKNYIMQDSDIVYFRFNV
ncbi:redox-regulated ATPase YchF [Rickettsia endosymbiont of Cardiosporidium cionae]|uniref:redox-regulated ATPase YchF n=1 Tax=Rickettsia endosymbiont of Cardiosporidium cionae TaxID=2777155 RepID=UPI001895A8F1|nr:redox-regulated ATPase YchF [Rickettsia endosymbiont of Cardiosporidium cionae]KAF8818934.1 redox-regulated ATPase YchF [Rickettsia endosymbiont of Cardiosporidium cionae]